MMFQKYLILCALVACAHSTSATDWEEYTDRNGRKYYHSVATNKTQWSKPANFTVVLPFEKNDHVELMSGHGKLKKYDQGKITAISLCSECLLPGWVAAVDENGKQIYRKYPLWLFQRKTGKPHPDKLGAYVEQTEVRPPDALPDGWTESKTKDGRTYYRDANTQKTTWVKPECKKCHGGGWIGELVLTNRHDLPTQIIHSASGIHLERFIPVREERGKRVRLRKSSFTDATSHLAGAPIPGARGTITKKNNSFQSVIHFDNGQEVTVPNFAFIVEGWVRRRLTASELLARHRLTHPYRDSPVLVRLLEKIRRAQRA